ncbi:aminoacyl-tRNA hydrolase [Rhodoferax sp.]|uniref:aminoacyl-tRNA hydrolase n=1 Tax=Rhodoferax sp. TaxID=50421 RepID=UPI002723CB9D|nr:aminoacyl-tRNA hydrolase [Rhodoferax sp.]MDO9195022.1 aminoacyl-tRNA hydrolase [Rhodoferax sp.]
MASSIRKMVIRVRDALAWRLHRLLGDRLVYDTLLAAAKRWRRAMRRPVYIAVAGSAGKTTAKELMLGMLSQHGKGVGNVGSFNNIEEIAKALMRVRPWHRFFVTELSEDRPGVMDRPLALVQPSVGIVTVLGDDHLASFDSRDAIAREMSKLVAALPATGTAVLNANDPAVLAMAASSTAKVISYGASASADLRAEDIRSVWPDRLRMTLVYGPRRVPLQTQLCGTHWIPSVLGAVGGGLATGMTLKECAAGLANVAPFTARMQPVSTPDGVTFIRDDFKAPLWTIGACFEFMKLAQAKRKIIIFGTLSDYGGGSGASKKYAEVARGAQEVADVTIFVGPWASSAHKARQPGDKDSLLAFSQVRDASAYVNSISRAGDLILLKGTNKQDHLIRMILARGEGVACWRDDCERQFFCDECPDRHKPSGAQSSLSLPIGEYPKPSAPTTRVINIHPEQTVIVGLGNPEPEYANTPHNVGYAVVEQLAASIGLAWNVTQDASIAQGSLDGQQVCLVKVMTPMNLTGAGLRRLVEGMSFSPSQCILVFDDLDLPLGAIRTRLGGSAGGHRGVASILEAFQTDAFRRVKVGVGQAGTKVNRAEYVLTPFAGATADAADLAVRAATTRAREMLASRPKAP